MRRYLPPGHERPTLDYPPRATVGDLLRGSAQQYAERPALRDGDLVLTYGELLDHAARIAGGLRREGVRPGEAVALHLTNSAWFTTCYYAILLAGAVVTPINPTLPAALVREQLEEAGAVAVITHPALLPITRQARPDAVRLMVTTPPSAAAPDHPEADSDVPADAVPLERLLDAAPLTRIDAGPDDLAHLSFTGGTTGRSKAVEVTHRNVVANALQVSCFRGAALPRTTEDGAVVLEPLPEARTPYIGALGTGRTVGLAPFFHAMGLVGQTANVLGGGEVIIPGRFDPVMLLDLIERHAVTSLPGSPALFHALLAVADLASRDLSSVTAVNSGAAPIESATLARLGGLFPHAVVVEGYGLTEATMALTLHPLAGPGVAPEGSVGAALFDTELAIRPIGGGPDLPVGETGEVWARGPQVTRGYRGHPELTAEQYVDGWLRTGDLGRLDEDGWLYLVGRAKDMLIYKGYNVYPSPLEAVLVEHPAVAQASVVGVPEPAVGEIPVAFVVTRPAGAGTPELAEELMAYVAARVAPYSRVREVVFCDALPTSAAGKVLKSVLRERAGTRGGRS